MYTNTIILCIFMLKYDEKHKPQHINLSKIPFLILLVC